MSFVLSLRTFSQLKAWKQMTSTTQKMSCSKCDEVERSVTVDEEKTHTQPFSTFDFLYSLFLNFFLSRTIAIWNAMRAGQPHTLSSDKWLRLFTFIFVMILWWARDFIRWPWRYVTECDTESWDSLRSHPFSLFLSIVLCIHRSSSHVKKAIKIRLKIKNLIKNRLKWHYFNCLAID